MKRPAADMSPGLASDYPPDPHAKPVETTDVLVVGAGPAGLMLATQLSRCGIRTKIIDDRPTATTTGRADGLQPKTIETLKQMRLAEPVLRKGVKVYDICFWNSSVDSPLQRRGREVHYPPVVDVLEPFILLVHQGMVEELFLEDMAPRGLHVDRSCVFESYKIHDASEEREKPEKEKDDGAKEDGKAEEKADGDGDEKMGGMDAEEREAENRRLDKEFPVEAAYMDQREGVAKTVRAKYVVGCDGAHSAVRRSMPGVEMVGESTDVFWGVLDGVIETDFPDLWSKCAISNHEAGTILCIPRERNMTRLYIELSSGGLPSKAHATSAFVQARAAAIMSPYKVSWRSIEWFGVYQIGQRVASSFAHANRVFIAGDASHTHSPKAAQGMNVSMHDTYNISWKLALVLHGLAREELLETYAEERRKIACDLIKFDHAHAQAFLNNDAKALAQNFKTNIRFISGVGATYSSSPSSPLTQPLPMTAGTRLVPGEILPPAKATRFVDTNPVDIQLDIPVLGQFRLYFLAPDFHASLPFLAGMSTLLTTRPTSATPAALLPLLRASALAHRLPTPTRVPADEPVQPSRYAATSRLFTPALITLTPQTVMELADLPPMFRESKWCVYWDNSLKRAESPLRSKWVDERDGIEDGETQIVVVRPDGYVGAVSERFADSSEGIEEAAVWVGEYFKGFLRGWPDENASANGKGREAMHAAAVNGSLPKVNGVKKPEECAA